MDEPLGKTQVIPYINLIGQFSEVHLISFEKKKLTNSEKSLIVSKLHSNKTRWSPKNYHKSPRMMATIYDILSMIYLLFLDRQKSKIHYVHCRGYVTCIAAFVYSIFFKRVRYIFDMRAFWPDELVSAKSLRKSSLIYFLLKKVEKLLISNSYGTIVLTNAAKKYLLNQPEFNHKNFYTIPTCVNHDKFTGLVKNRTLIEKESIVIGTIGTLSSGWFMLREFADFLNLFRKTCPRAIIRIITQDNPDELLSKISVFGVPEKEIEIYSASSDEMPNEIAKFDIIVMFFVSNFSKLGSAPTRFGEALASGVPCVVNSGVGDLDKIVYENNVGIVATDFSDVAMTENCNEVLSLLGDNSLKIRCVEASKKYFSLELAVNSYQELYG